MTDMDFLSHIFIFDSGIWLGKGVIKLNVAKEDLNFSMRWTIEKEKKSQIIALQEIEISGIADVIKNQFYFYNIKPNRFKIRLESQNLGEVVGDGVMKKNLLAWEFRLPDGEFEGYEVYNLQEDNSFSLMAEYSTSENFRTKIQGQIWKKTSKS